MRTILALMLVVALAVLAPLGCGQASSPTERQDRDVGVEKSEAPSRPASESTPSEPTTPSAGGGTTVGEAFAEAKLEPVSDSSVSGDAVFKEVGSLGVQLELTVSGLPNPGETYFAQVHKGSCAEVPRGGVQESDDHGDDHHGHDHEHGVRVGPALALVRLDRLLGRPEYADHGEFEPPPANELPGNADHPVDMASSADGTASVTNVLEGVGPEQFTSGISKYIDVRAPNEEAPEDWPTLACADLGDAG